MKTKSNVGPHERYVRFGVGVAALLATLAPGMGRWRWLLGVLGVANVVTATVRYCPTNTLLGIDNTKGRELLHFTRSRPIGRRLNRMQRRIGATI